MMGYTKLHARSSAPESQVYALQLSKDHVPENPEEHSRILLGGGVVKRLVDENGNHIGPYRVWENNSSAPGLALSRSLGDKIGKSIGVSAEPQITQHVISDESDLFLVLASDGVWTVMENEHVINFIDCCRGICSKEIAQGKEKEVTIKNSCLAQLVCEEARVRWIRLVEEDDIPIDDISCILFEFPREFNPEGDIWKHRREFFNQKKASEFESKEEVGVFLGNSRQAKRISISVNDSRK
jgi:serine/threonine protein phosphatase PrpC